MKKRVFGFACLLVILHLFTLQAKVLVVVDKSYYDNNSVEIQGTNRITRYLKDIKAFDEIETELLIYQNLMGVSNVDKVSDLWHKLIERYNASISGGDAIKGVVLVGDLPVPVYSDPNEPYSCVMDYPYMDLIDQGTPYNSSTNLKLIWNYDETLKVFRRAVPNSSNPTGSNFLDVWISRIYSKNLHVLREPGAPIGDYLTEHEIISNYLDKVHVRMTQPAKMPPRAMAMGHIENWYETPEDGRAALESSFPFQQLSIDNYYYIYNTMDGDHRINTPSNFQSQLQSGPYGNINHDMKGENSIDNRYTENFDPSDTLGLEWIGIFEHSSPNVSEFNRDSEHSEWRGVFSSFDPAPYNLNKHTTGGLSNGSYYAVKSDECGIDPQSFQLTFTPQTSEQFDIFMWVDISMLEAGYIYEDNTLYLNMYKGDGSQNVLSVNINPRAYTSSQGSGWMPIGQANLNNEEYFLRFEPFLSLKNQQPGDKEILPISAIKISGQISGSVSYFTVDNADYWYSNQRPIDRNFNTMQDNGGQSKAHFFLSKGCKNSNFLHKNNISLSYAMGHSGLICLGTSTSHAKENTYKNFLIMLKSDDISFGSSYLSYINEKRSNYTYSLMGAGTLKAKPYKEFIPIETKDIKVECLGGSAEDIAVANNGTIFSIYRPNYWQQQIRYFNGLEWALLPPINSYNEDNYKDISVDENNNVNVVLESNINQIYTFNNNNNTWFSTRIVAKAIDHNKKGVLGTISTDGSSVFRYANSQWEDCKWNTSEFSQKELSKIAVDTLGFPWVITNNYEIYRYCHGVWEHIPGKARDINFDSDNNAYIIEVYDGNDPWPDYGFISRMTGNGWQRNRYYYGQAVDGFDIGPNDEFVFADLNKVYRQILPNNMLENGDFHYQTFGRWDHFNIEGGVSTASITPDSYCKDNHPDKTNTACKIEVTDGGNELWSSLLVYDSHWGINIDALGIYKVSFWAKQDNATPTNSEILATVSRNRDPWTEYGALTTNLTNEFKRYEFTFTMRTLTDPEAILQFCVGKHERTVYFDNIIVQKIGEIEKPKYYGFRITSGPNGVTEPEGLFGAQEGGYVTTWATPNPGYEVDNVTIGGVEVSGIDFPHTFENITSNYEIYVTFKESRVITCDAWVQPNGLYNAYQIGDTVEFEGSCYESLISNNVWSPVAYPAGWQLVN